MEIYRALQNTIRRDRTHFCSLIAQNPWADRSPVELNAFDISQLQWKEQERDGEARRFTAKHEGQVVELVLEPVDGGLFAKHLGYLQ